MSGALHSPIAIAEDRSGQELAGGLFHRLAVLIQRRHFARHAVILGIGTAAAQSFSVTLAPLITRLYTPSDLGLLGLYTSFLGVAAVATSLKYELAIVSASDQSEAAQLTWASVLLCVPTSLLAGTVLYGVIHSACFGFADLPRYSILVMVPTLLFTGMFTALRYWAIREERFGLISKTSIAQHATRSLLQASLGFLSAGPGSLFLGEMAGRVVGVGSMFRHAWSALKEPGRRASRGDIARALHRNRKLAVYSFPSSLIDTLALNIPVPLLVGLYGSAAGGQFALVQKVLSVPLALMAASVADAFHSRLATCARETPDRMLELFKKTSYWLFMLGLGPAALLALAGPRIFAVVFGHSWAAAGTLAAISTPWFLAQFVVSPLSRLVFVLSGQESKLVYDIVLLVSMSSVYVLAHVRGLTLIQTVWAFALINAAAYIIYYLVLLRIVVRSTLRLATQTTE